MSLFFIFISVTFLSILLFDSNKYGITPAPTSKKVRKKILDEIPSQISGDFYELGSGFGHMVFEFAKRYQNQKVHSFEIAKIPFLFQKSWIFFKKPKNIELSYKNFLSQDLSDAGLVFCYLYRAIMPKLAKKFEKELKEGSYVVTHTFAIGKWKPVKTIHANDLYNTPIYIYKIGAH